MKKLYASLLSLACVATMSAFTINTTGEFSMQRKAKLDDLEHQMKAKIVESTQLNVNGKTVLEEGAWESIGTCQFTDVLFTNTTFDAEIFEKSDMPGFYAIPEAWSRVGVDGVLPFFFYAADPEYVLVPEQSTGVVLTLSYTGASGASEFTSAMAIQSLSMLALNNYNITKDLFLENFPAYNIFMKDKIVRLPANCFQRNFPDAGDAAFSDGTLIKDQWLDCTSWRGLVRLPGALGENYDWSVDDANASFTDPLAIAWLSDDAAKAVNVVVERSNIWEGTYRVVDPYKQVFGEDNGYYGNPLEFNMADPKCVLVPFQNIGIYISAEGMAEEGTADWVWYERGQWWAGSLSSYFMEDLGWAYDKWISTQVLTGGATGKDLNIAAGTDRGGNTIITFPVNAFYSIWPDWQYVDEEGKLYSDELFIGSEKGQIKFKAGAGVEAIEADDNAPAVYYNLQGMRVDNPTNGIFIKREGNKATKVML